MHKIRGIICFYLTVAVMITVALVPFASGNAVKNHYVSVDDDSITAVTEAVENTTSATFSDNSAGEYTEGESAKYEAVNGSEADSDAGPFEDTVILQDNESSADFIPESENNDDAEVTVPEIHNGNKVESIIIENDADNDYVPGGKNENVSGLNFFTDTQGLLESPGSINVYEFTLDSRSVFRYAVLHDSFNGTEGWNFDLYEEYYINGDGKDTAYRLINSLETTTASSDRSAELGLAPGNYRLVVSAGKSYTGSVYSIRVNCSDTYEYEIECNDNIYRYTEIYGNVPIKGSASKLPDRQDDDWYMFRMYKDGFAELSFTHPEEKDKLTVCWQVIFYSEDMTPVFSVNSTFDKGVFESGRIGLDKGNYYIAVKNRVYSDKTYTLTVSRNTVSDHENERNDTTGTANVIAPNTTMLGIISSQINGIDVDYYKFTLEKPGTVAIEFSHTPLDDEDDKLGWNYSLIDSDSNVLFCGVSAWIDDVSVSSLTGLDAGTYYIRVDSSGLYHSTENYYLTLIYDECIDWETECNDSFAAADALTENEPLNGLLAERSTDYDYDYFGFEITEESDVSVIFSHEALSYSREIFVFTLYDENEAAVKTTVNGKEVIRVSIKSDSEEVTIDYSALAPGRYYIKVATGIFFDAIGYSLMYKTS